MPVTEIHHTTANLTSRSLSPKADQKPQSRDRRKRKTGRPVGRPPKIEKK